MARKVQSSNQTRLSYSRKMARFARRMKARSRRFTLNRSALTSSQLLTQRPEAGSTEIVLSLTTYGRRLHDVYLVIESIAHQTLRPSRIILWLDEAEYERMTLPVLLQRQIERGLEVRFCEDLGSYKKLIPTLGICPQARIVTIDDDVLYPKDMLQQLALESRKFPDAVIAHRARRIQFFDGALLPYSDWEFISTEVVPSIHTVPIGIGGVLYPPETFHFDIAAVSKFMRLAPDADDIWFKAMSLLQGVKCKKVGDIRPFDTRFLELPGSQVSALHHSNLGEGRNDKQITSVFEAYKLYDLIRC